MNLMNYTNIFIKFKYISNKLSNIFWNLHTDSLDKFESNYYIQLLNFPSIRDSLIPKC